MASGILWRTIFGATAFLLGYTYVGFPIILALRSRRRPYPPLPPPDPAFAPSVTMIIAVLNEEDVIVQKLDNARSLAYPQNKIEIIVAANGSEDNTETLVETYPAENIHLLSLPERGKNNALNAAASVAQGEILVFTDADSRLTPDALAQLVAPFKDAQIGAVGGDYRHGGDQNKGQGERSYWNLDRWLKRQQSMAGSMTSASGALLAIRRELFRPIPAGVTDDFFLSTQAPLHRRRLVFAPGAIAVGPVALARDEFARKVRIMTRGLNSVWQQRSLLNPHRYGFYSLQLFTHKVLRRLMIIPLLVLGVANIALAPAHLLYRLLALGQTFLYSLGAIGLWLRDTPAGRHRIFSLPGYFVSTNLAAGMAAINFVRRKRYDSWAANR